MRFSIIAGPRQRADLGQSAADAWWNYVDDAVLANDLGYDGYYVGEHHFCFASGNSSPLTMLTAIAARTQAIRVGTSVICAPFHNPLRLAEDIAAVDIASNGRFDLGIGVGSQWEEFNTFGIDSSERFGRTWEIIDIIEQCLNSGEESSTSKAGTTTFLRSDGSCARCRNVFRFSGADSVRRACGRPPSVATTSSPRM